MLLPSVCCTPNSHVTDRGGSPGSALVLGSAAWEVQPLGSERVQLLQCLTGSLNFLGKMPQGGLQHWHVIWMGDKHAAQEIAEQWDLGDFAWQGL